MAKTRGIPTPNSGASSIQRGFNIDEGGFYLNPNIDWDKYNCVVSTPYGAVAINALQEILIEDMTTVSLLLWLDTDVVLADPTSVINEAGKGLVGAAVQAIMDREDCSLLTRISVQLVTDPRSNNSEIFNVAGGIFRSMADNFDIRITMGDERYPPQAVFIVPNESASAIMAREDAEDRNPYHTH